MKENEEEKKNRLKQNKTKPNTFLAFWEKQENSLTDSAMEVFQVFP